MKKCWQGSSYLDEWGFHRTERDKTRTTTITQNQTENTDQREKTRRRATSMGHHNHMKCGDANGV